MNDSHDFYVPDEPLDEVVAAYDGGRKVVTRRPTQSLNERITVNSSKTRLTESRLGETTASAGTTKHLRLDPISA